MARQLDLTNNNDKQSSIITEKLKKGLDQQEKSFNKKEDELENNVREAYVKFLEDDSRVNLKALDNYTFKRGQIVIELFSYRKSPKKSGLYLPKHLYAGDSFEFAIAIGKVLGGDPEALEEYPAGSFVHLKDGDYATVPNPRYGLWANNSMNKSNAEKIGSEPPKYLNMIDNIRSRALFVIEKVKTKYSDADWNTFLLNKATIEGGVKDPMALIPGS